VRNWGRIVAAVIVVVAVSGVIVVTRSPDDALTAGTTGSAPDVPAAGSLGAPEPGGSPVGAATTATAGTSVAPASTATSGPAASRGDEEPTVEAASRRRPTTTTTSGEGPTSTTAPAETTTTTGSPPTSTTTSRPSPGTPSSTAPSSTTTSFRPPDPAAQPRIVYMREVDAPFDVDLFASDLDGRHEVALSDGPELDKEPAVSPDGRTIAFIRGRPDDRTSDQVWLMDADGRNSRMVFVGTPQSLSNPAWSPDGRFLAMSAGYNLAQPPNYNWRVGIAVLDLQTGGFTDVTYGTPVLDRDLMPAWSPDGGRIAFSRQGAAGSDRDDYNVYVVNRDGSGLTQITSAPADRAYDAFHWPTWSSDGKRMLLYHQGTSDGGLIILNLDGTGQRTIPSDSQNPDGAGCGGTLNSPTWSPDEQVVLFSACQGLRVVNSDGTGLRKLDPKDHTKWRYAADWLH